MSQDNPKAPAPALHRDFSFLTAALPGLADRLARQITDEMIPHLERTGLSLDNMTLTAALEFRRVDGQDEIRVALSVGRPGAEDGR